MVEYSGALVTLGKAFATFAIIKAIAQVNTWRIALAASTRARWANVAAMDATGKRAVTLGNILKRMPTVVPITVTLLGLELLAKGLESIGRAIGDELGENSQAMKEAGEISRRLQETLYQEAVARKAVANGLIEFRDTAVQTSAQVAAMAEAERQSYQGRVEGLKQYLHAQLAFLLRMQAMGIATDDQLKQLEQVKLRLREANEGYRAIAEGARVAGGAMKNGIGAGAQLVLEQLVGIDRDAKLASTSISKLFQALNFADTRSLEDVAVALAHTAAQGAAAGRNVRDGLLDVLQQLSGEELLRFQQASQMAFDALPAAAVDAAAVLQQTLAASLQNLGVSAERVGLSFGKAGRDAIASFAAISENALATGAQIEEAFRAALGKVSTLDEARTLGTLLEAAGTRGKVGFDQAGRSAAALHSRIRDITNAMDPLNNEFGRLGIQSQASLNAARDAAKSAFEEIRRGAAQGKASIEDVRRAFRAYADSAREAAADSDVTQKVMVEAQLAHLGAIYRVNDAMDDLKEKGTSATRAVADGAAGAARELDGVAASAGSAASATEAVGAAGSNAASGLGGADSAAQGLSFSLGDLSGKARELFHTLGGQDSLEKFATLLNGISKQRRDLAEYNAELERTLKGNDEMGAQGRRAATLPWGSAKPLPWIVSPPKPDPDPDPEPVFPPGNLVALSLGCALISTPGLAPLNLGATACYLARPQQRTYVVINSISVVRIPDRTPIEVEGVSILSSVDAWGISFDLDLADSAQLALLKPTAAGPRQVEVTLNGYVWTAIIETYRKQREWNRVGVSLTGRSRTALLAAPYAPARVKATTEDRSVAQLVAEELADTGFTADYGTVDWVVPAGAWFYDGTPAMDAIARLAGASGAVVQSDPASQQLHVRPRYPASPWDWRSTQPDHVLQEDIITSESLQVRSAPLYDAVIVTGELAGKGVTCKVRRQGEAGQLFAPQASDPLINTSAAGAERGRNILSDRGEQAAIDLVIPLFGAPLVPGQIGRVQPLDLVEVVGEAGTWHGLCTAVRTEARADSKALVIEQTITLERHYTDAN